MSGKLKEFTKKWIVTMVVVPSLACKLLRFLFLNFRLKLYLFFQFCSNAHGLDATSKCRSFCSTRREQARVSLHLSSSQDTKQYSFR